MKFTQGQLRQTVGISKETFRHWRTVIPALSREQGHSPCYLPKDILATSIIRKICIETGVPIRSLKGVSESIFILCDVESWVELEGQCLLIDVINDDCSLQREIDLSTSKDVQILCPLTPIISYLQESLSHSQYFGSQGYFALSTTEKNNSEELQRHSR
ncbi:hypothetical protein MLD52_08035 [Puniceicoccaceae bacterium K14]|nr:hypothetical protein [Puniceicoccaceae bacterium K14]